MSICGYLVIPVEGSSDALAERLAALPGCDVVRARNREVLVLVTDTAGRAEDSALRERLTAMPDIRALVLTFGDIDPDAPPTECGP
jgi:nitrate reductase NapAB chaperone NapD